MDLPTDFETFLTKIRPTTAQRNDLKDAHIRLRDRLMKNASLSSVVETTFLQGSYRRHTAVRPSKGSRSDVDIIVVTKFGTHTEPAAAMGVFKSFLNEHYAGKWRTQGRSFGIQMSKVDLDVVVTAAPPENEKLSLISWAQAFLSGDEAGPNWKQSPLLIPDRAGGYWDKTDPLEQISRTHQKNAATSGNFVNVVKALKWWRLEHPTQNKHPKGFPLERLIGECCPDTITSVSQGVLATLEGIQAHTSPYAKPFLPDYGVPSHDVFAQLSISDWRAFRSEVDAAVTIARAATNSDDINESRRLWRDLFGTKFPGPTGHEPRGGGGFEPPREPGDPDFGRFA